MANNNIKIKLAKFLLPFLTPLTQNEYTVTDCFHFAEEICKQDPNFYMASLDVDSLFTNIPLDETIDICIDSLYKDDENTTKIPKNVFRNLLKVATKESFFMFNNKFYKKIDGVDMGSPLGPALANIFNVTLSFTHLLAVPIGSTMHTLLPSVTTELPFHRTISIFPSLL